MLYCTTHPCLCCAIHESLSAIPHTNRSRVKSHQYCLDYNSRKTMVKIMDPSHSTPGTLLSHLLFPSRARHTLPNPHGRMTGMGIQHIRAKLHQIGAPFHESDTPEDVNTILHTNQAAHGFPEVEDVRFLSSRKLQSYDCEE